MFSSSHGTKNICAAWQMISATLKVRIGEGWLTISYTACVKSFKKTWRGDEPQDFHDAFNCFPIKLVKNNLSIICFYFWPFKTTFLSSMGWTKGSIPEKNRKKGISAEHWSFPVIFTIWSQAISVIQVLSVIRTKPPCKEIATKSSLILIIAFFVLYATCLFFFFWFLRLT